MFEALGRVMYRRRRWVVAGTLVFVVFAAVWGTAPCQWMRAVSSMTQTAWA